MVLRKSERGTSGPEDERLDCSKYWRAVRTAAPQCARERDILLRTLMLGTYRYKNQPCTTSFESWLFVAGRATVVALFLISATAEYSQDL